VKQNRMVWVPLSLLILFTLACNLPGRVAEEVGEQIEQKIEDQLQEALEATGNEELAEEFSGIAEQFSGQNLGQLMDNFSSDNWTREDIPLPPNAEVIAGYSGEAEGDFILLKTSMSIDEAEAWMLAKLKENGWSQGDMEFVMDQARMYDFSKGNERLGLVMSSSIASGETNVSITVYH